ILDETISADVAGDSHHDGYRSRSTLRCCHRRWRHRHYYIRLPTHEFFREVRQLLRFALRLANLNQDIFARDVAKLLQSLPETLGLRPLCERASKQKANTPHLALLLRERAERRRERTCPDRDEQLATRNH